MDPVSIGRTVDHDHAAVMEQTVDDCGGAEVVVEILAPVFPWYVAGDNRGAALVVAGKQYLLHKPGAEGLFTFDLLYADLIYHEHVGAHVRFDRRASEGAVG